ncbi:hypothetical protein [Pedobacter sp. ASV28]|uniref:hypothetical protein n=1 Tax=Pedobacter sp. ASV28 TaxID=2795123 RepID=UPI0018EE12E8|nr:hypothetical protein [Pedobacter sp. ASV28]
MDILQYLIELLKIRKEIGIEGLGTLYKKKTPGRYDADTHTFLPPNYVLDFTNSVKETAHLIQYIQSKRNISTDAANYFVSQFVEEVKKQLREKGEYQLDGLGNLKLDNDQISFTPSKDSHVGFDFYALPSITGITTKEKTDNLSSDQPSEIENLQAGTVQDQLKSTSQTEDVDHEKIEENSVALPEIETNEENISAEEQHSIPHTEHSNVEDANEETSVSAQEEENISNHTNNEKRIEEDFNSESPSSAPQENTDPITDENEVYDEIGEVDVKNPTNHPEIKEENPTAEDWDFEQDNIIVIEENKPHENTISEFYLSDKTNDNNDEDDTLKLISTTKEWDFDQVNDKFDINNSDDELIGEFDEMEDTPQIEEEKTSMPLYQKVTILLLILLVIGVIAYYINPNLLNNFHRNETNPDEKIAVPIEDHNQLKTQADSLSFADSIMKNAEKVGLKVEPAKDTIKVTTKTKPVNTTTYEIIGAAFAKDQEVEQYISHMKKKGFEAKIANMPGKIYKKISIASYVNRDSADKDLKKLRLQLKNSDLYIFVNKNQ